MFYQSLVNVDWRNAEVTIFKSRRPKVQGEVRIVVVDKAGTAMEHGGGESVFMPRSSLLSSNVVGQRRDVWAECFFDGTEEGGAYVLQSR